MVPWYGLASMCGSVAFYISAKCSESDAYFLKRARMVSHLQDLGDLIDNVKDSPLYVSITGRASADAPINCECSDLKGVILEEEAKKYFLKMDRSTHGEWRKDSTSVFKGSKVVPWYLDDGTGRARVLGARGAKGLTYTVASKFFEPNPGTHECVQGLRVLGLKRIERVLPIGTFLTVIGEAVKDSNGTILIQKPYEKPFYVSRNNIDTITTNLDESAQAGKFGSVFLAVLGGCLIATGY